jgi:hypothetical protein
MFDELLKASGSRAICDTHMNNLNSDPVPQREAGPVLADELYLERRQLEALLNLSDATSTETLRLALRRYRSLFTQPSPY